VASFFTERGSLQINEGPPATGRAAITAVAQEFMTAFPDMIVKMDGLDEDRNGYIYKWTLIGTNSGPEGTGKRVHIHGYEEWTMGRDGLIEKSSGHFDPEDYQRQLQHGVGE
jgi:hypothetical protein